LGMPVSLQRNVAFFHKDPHRGNSAAWLGLGTGTFLLAIICMAAARLEPQMAAIYGTVTAGPLWTATTLLTFAQGCVTMLAMIHLAKGQVVCSSILTLAGYGVAPVIPLLLSATLSIAQVMQWAAIFALLSCLPSIIQMILGTCDWNHVRKDFGNVLQFGANRTPANMLDNSMETIVLASATAYQGSALDMVSLPIALSFLRLLNPVTGALNQVLIPATARMAADEDNRTLAHQVQLIFQSTLHIGFFAVSMLLAWAPAVIRWWLGTDYLFSVPMVRTYAFAFLPVLVYTSLRGVIDGYTSRAVNTWNLLGSVAFMFLFLKIVLLKNTGGNGIYAAYITARIVLAIATLRYLFHEKLLSSGKLMAAPALLVSIALGALSWTAIHTYPALLVGDGFLFALMANGCVFLLCMFGLKVEWAILLVRRIRGWLPR